MTGNDRFCRDDQYIETEIFYEGKAGRMGKQINQYVLDYVLFDLETTGISTNTDEVIEISALKVRGGEVVEEFSTLVNPKRRIPHAASAVNHITDEMVKDAPGFDVVLKQFLDFVGNDILVGHNIARFDMQFLYRDARKFYELEIENDVADTLRIAKNVLPALPHHRLGDLAEYYGLSTVGAHRALADCKMNQIVYEKLGKELEATKTGASDVKLCPECGSVMKLRNGKFGQFYGCSGYPACKHTEKA